MSLPGMPSAGGQPQSLYKPTILPDIVIISVLSAFITFTDAIPSNILSWFASTIGMLVLFSASLVLTFTRGTLVGFIAAICALIIYNAGLRAYSPTERASATEGFGCGNDKRWFVEKVLDERPRIIHTEKVTTLPAI
jgi:hypothetical protein